MMSVTPRQWNAYLALLLQNVDPDALETEVLQQAIVGNPTTAGRNFTRFLQSGCRFNLGGLKITPALFDPTTFLGSDWQIIPEEHDARNDDLTEVDFAQANFLSCLKNGEILITIEEKLIRLKRDKSGYIRYGATVFKGLWDDYQAREKDSVLETLYCEKSITRLDFPGDVLAQAPYGCRHVLCLYRDGGGWYWLADGGCTDYLSAVSQVPPKAGQVAS